MNVMERNSEDVGSMKWTTRLDEKRWHWREVGNEKKGRKEIGREVGKENGTGA